MLPASEQFTTVRIQTRIRPRSTPAANRTKRSAPAGTFDAYVVGTRLRWKAGHDALSNSIDAQSNERGALVIPDTRCFKRTPGAAMSVTIAC